MTEDEMAEEYANNEINKMFVDESEEVYVRASTLKQIIKNSHLKGLAEGEKIGYNKANEWHYVKDGDLPRQYGHTCFSIDVLANNKKWVYYEFSSGKWFCGNKEVKLLAWKEIVLPKESEND